MHDKKICSIKYIHLRVSYSGITAGCQSVDRGSTPLTRSKMKKFQKKVDDWVSQYKIGYFKPLEILARLTEEVGELARELNHRFGPKKKKTTEENKEIGDEIADIIFTLACLSNSLNINTDKHLKKCIDKCYQRDKNRWDKK